MTDFTAQTPTTRPHIRRHGLTLAFGALQATLAAFGTALTAVLTAYGRALELGFSAFYRGPSVNPVSDEDLGGRDPNW